MYKIGDKVKIIDAMLIKDMTLTTAEMKKTIGMIGVIRMCDYNDDYGYYVQFDNYEYNGWWYSEYDLINLRKEKLKRVLCIK